MSKQRKPKRASALPSGPALVSVGAALSLLGCGPRAKPVGQPPQAQYETQPPQPGPPQPGPPQPGPPEPGPPPMIPEPEPGPPPMLPERPKAPVMPPKGKQADPSAGGEMAPFLVSPFDRPLDRPK